MVRTDSPLRLDNVTKRFGDTVVLDGSSMTLQRGEVIGWLDPNGAGKTTALRILLGIVKPTSGVATVLELDCRRELVQVYRRLAYMPSEFSVRPNLTGGQMFDLLGASYGGFDSEVRQHDIARYGFDPRRKGRTYSKGNRHEKVSAHDE